MKNWNYCSGMYFVTVCTENREPIFGEILDDQIQLSDIGKVVHDYWVEIPEHYPCVNLDQCIVMPDHIHGILILESPEYIPADERSNTFRSLRHHSLSAVIGSFKSAVTRWCRNNEHGDFAWQSRFHERVIDSEEQLENVRKYIFENPMHWNDRDVE